MRNKVKVNDLPVLDSLAAGVDVGSTRMYVSIGANQPEDFGTTTDQLYQLRDYLKKHQVQSVAMEATGIYWLCLYEILEAAGMRVVMVNGRYVKNLPGRKSDVSDAQWLALLHSRGLLRAGFVPDEATQRLQDYVRLRQDHVSQGASQVLLMQKALERMNLKVHTVIRAINGVSGQAMMRAIVKGEREPQKLLELCDGQIQQRKGAAVLDSLRGNFRSEHIFALRQALEVWDFYQLKIAECDLAIQKVLEEMTSQDPNDPSDGLKGRGTSGLEQNEANASTHSPSGDVIRAAKVVAKKKRPNRNTPGIKGLNGMLELLCGGKNVTVLPGIADATWLQLISELGTDMGAFKTAKHFVSWCGLAPGKAQSGKRSRAVRRGTNRVGRLFCMAAQSVTRSSNDALGSFYRRLRATKGGSIATKALARKIAILFWRLMVHGLDYVKEGLEEYNAKTAVSDLRNLEKAAERRGYGLYLLNSSEPQVVG